MPSRGDDAADRRGRWWLSRDGRLALDRAWDARWEDIKKPSTTYDFRTRTKGVIDWYDPSVHDVVIERLRLRIESDFVNATYDAQEHLYAGPFSKLYYFEDEAVDLSMTDMESLAPEKRARLQSALARDIWETWLRATPQNIQSMFQGAALKFEAQLYGTKEAPNQIPILHIDCEYGKVPLWVDESGYRQVRSQRDADRVGPPSHGYSHEGRFARPALRR